MFGLLETVGLARRVPVPGQRGHAYQVAPDAIIRLAAEPTRFRLFRELMDRGMTLVGGEDAPRADRLRVTRDFYAFVERELPGSSPVRIRVLKEGRGRWLSQPSASRTWSRRTAAAAA